MSPRVVDTNVWVTAAGKNPEAGPRCIRRCAEWLRPLEENGKIAVDQDHKILGEYRRNLPPQCAPSRILNRMVQTGRMEHRACRWDRDGQWMASKSRSRQAGISREEWEMP